MSEPRLTRDHVVWAYRLLLDRDPESEQAIEPKLRAWRTTRELRTDLLSSEEYRVKNPDVAHASGSTCVIKPIGDVRLWVDLADHVIGIPILRDAYETDAVQLATALVRPGDVAVDVGAHIGFFSIQLARAVGPHGMVYAFEPLDRNADLLERSVAENGFGARLTVVRAAVSDVTGDATLRFARETLNTGGAFLAEGSTPGDEGLATRRVPTVRLDDAAVRRPVRLIKMDVEGAEPKVIRGARSLLAADRPYLISEIHPGQLARVSQSSAAAVLEDLQELGYRAHRIEHARIGGAVRPGDLEGVATIVFEPC
jgi:FkbM family methyltransferase